MAQIGSGLKNNHRKEAIHNGNTFRLFKSFNLDFFHIIIFLIKLFIGIPIQILLFLPAMLTLSLRRLWLLHKHIELKAAGSEFIPGLPVWPFFGRENNS